MNGILSLLIFGGVLALMLIFAFDVDHPEKKIIKMNDKGHNDGYGWFLAVILSILTGAISVGAASGIESVVRHAWDLRKTRR